MIAPRSRTDPALPTTKRGRSPSSTSDGAIMLVIRVPGFPSRPGGLRSYSPSMLFSWMPVPGTKTPEPAPVDAVSDAAFPRASTTEMCVVPGGVRRSRSTAPLLIAALVVLAAGVTAYFAFVHRPAKESPDEVEQDKPVAEKRARPKDEESPPFDPERKAILEARAIREAEKARLKQERLAREAAEAEARRKAEEEARLTAEAEAAELARIREAEETERLSAQLALEAAQKAKRDARYAARKARGGRLPPGFKA